MISSFFHLRSLTEAEQKEERLCNYERYRVLIHNQATGGNRVTSKMHVDHEDVSFFFFSLKFLVSEEQCLRDIEVDEKFGGSRDEHHSGSREAKKKK